MLIPHAIGFLSVGHYVPDLVSQLLRRAGDIESNPGPMYTRSQRVASQSGNHTERESRQDKPNQKMNTRSNTMRDRCTTPPPTPSSIMLASNTITTPKTTNEKSDSSNPPYPNTPHTVEASLIDRLDIVSPPTAGTQSSRNIIRTPVPATRTGDRMPRRKPANKPTKKKSGPPPEMCKMCKQPLDGKSVKIQCETCKGIFHKIKCGGRPRFHMDKFEGLNEKPKKDGKKKTYTSEKWICERCLKTPETGEEEEVEIMVDEIERSDQPEEMEPNTSEVPKIKKYCMAVECRHEITSKQGIFCNECGEGVHKQEECSGMKRKLRDDISSGKVKWKCDGCKGILANPYPKEDNRQIEYVIGKESDKNKNKKKKVRELRMIQWNADSYLSKKEEFANIVYERNIDIFVIQETKMITGDDTPTLPGYEIKRREREQEVGSELNRGGGLIIGVKDNIPISEIKNNLRGDQDKITEWMTIEIPTESKNNIRITNMYIPPIRRTEGERRRDRSSELDLSKWPCS